MSVNLSPMSPRAYSVGTADDPYKKYWLLILGGFVVTGAWLCIPIMETSVGSVHVGGASKPGGADAAGADQSLDSAVNPAGAPGAAVDLTIDGAKRKSKSGGDEDMTSMLYQGAAPEAGAAAAGAPLGDATAASASTLAQQLKDAGGKADTSGWTEKAQRGFDAPHLAGAGLSGSGSAHGGSSASMGLGTNFFGSKNAQVNFGAGGGLQDGGSESAGFKALKASAGAAAAPNLKGSNEALQAGMSRAFDGAKGKAPAAIGLGAMAQANAALSAAPANLKTPPNDAKIDSKTLPTPTPAPPAPAKQNMGQQLAMMAATALIGAAVGGLVGGLGGQMVASMGTSMMQAQMAKANANANPSMTSTQQKLQTSN